jgi:hypothetical protein
MRNPLKHTVMLVIGGSFLAGAAMAAEDVLVDGMAEKGTHGLVNIATGWMEFPMQVYKGYHAGIGGIEHPEVSRPLGALSGVFRGVGHAVGRTGWGVIQLGGFWTRNPTDNKDLLLLYDSEYAWETGIRKPLRCPDVDRGMEKVGHRIERGLRNFFGGPAEIPGQARKAHDQSIFVYGLPKGLWYASSRMIYGAGDVVLSPVPSDEVNRNVPFEEVEPWDAAQGEYFNNVK